MNTEVSMPPTAKVTLIGEMIHVDAQAMPSQGASRARLHIQPMATTDAASASALVTRASSGYSMPGRRAFSPAISTVYSGVVVPCTRSPGL